MRKRQLFALQSNDVNKQTLDHNKVIAKPERRRLSLKGWKKEKAL